MVVEDVPLSSLEMAHGALTYAVKGTGVPVVAVHGLPGSVRDFRRLGEAAPGVRMIRLNMPGFAGSGPLRRPGDWDALIGTVAEAASALAGGPFVMLGHSFGGVVALRAAARSGSCRGLALLAPAGLRPHRAMRQLPPKLALKGLKVSRISREVFFRAMRRLPIGVHASREDAASTLALLATVDFEASREAARSFRGPVFCASCLDDALIEPAVIEELLAELNTQEHLVFETGGHAPQRDHAAEVGAALLEFASACVPPMQAKLA